MRAPSQRGLTLIELLVGLGVIVILLTLITPSLRELIVLQRLKSANAEFVTDLQYARSEAVARNHVIHIKFFSNEDKSCYVVHLETVNGSCDCLSRAPGNVCGGTWQELRTTEIPASTDIRLAPTAPLPYLVFNSSGQLDITTTDVVFQTDRRSGERGKLCTTISPRARPTVCSADASINGVPPCPTPPPC